MEFPSKNTGVGSHSLLQGIFLTQRLNPGLSPALQADSLQSGPFFPPQTSIIWILMSPTGDSDDLTPAFSLVLKLKMTFTLFLEHMYSYIYIYFLKHYFIYILYFNGEGNDTPFQYSYLRNPIDRGAWWATVHGVAKSRTWLKWLSTLYFQKYYYYIYYIIFKISEFLNIFKNTHTLIGICQGTAAYSGPMYAAWLVFSFQSLSADYAPLWISCWLLPELLTSAT